MVMLMTGKKLIKAVISNSLIVVLMLMSVVVTSAQESDLVTMEVDDTTIQMGSSVSLTLSMDASIKATEIGVEGLDDFEVESTSQASTSSNINGVKTALYQYKLTLSPKAIGEFSLKAVVNDGTNVYESKTLVITVSERDENLDSESEDVFIKTVISEGDHYFGENIVLTYELYSRYNLDDYGFLDDVTYDEFIVNSIPKEDFESNIITINGNKYIKQVVKKDILLPTRSGDFEIPSYKFQANLSSGDFFSRSEPRYLDSEAISLSVKELPTANKPVNFSGIVGNLDIKSSVDKTEVAYGDAVTLQVLLTGTGNLDAIGSLYNEKQDGFTIYETEKSSEKNIMDSVYTESKEFDVIIVPKEIGELSLEAVDFWYFDTELKDYAKIEIPEQKIVVTGVKTADPVSIDSPVVGDSVFISQVNYKEQNDGMVTFQVSKKNLVIGVVLLAILLIGIIMYRILKSKPGNNKKKNYKKMIKAAASIDMLETIAEKIVFEKTGLNMKSQHSKTIMSYFDTKEEKGLIESIIIDIEKDKISKKQDISLVKEKLNALVNHMD